MGDVYGYQKLLLATGGAPRRLMFGGDEIMYFRTLDDYQKLRELSGRHAHFAVIGGGFIGSEIAAALASNGNRVTMVFPEAGIASRIFPRDLSDFISDYYRQRQVEVVPETMIAGLEVKNGIVVDASLRTSHSDIYAAGDVANFHNPLLGQRLRVEHEDNANTMGRMAGQAMAGKAVNYDHLPFFYSDLFDLGYEAVGETDSRLETVIDWKDPMRKGVIYYLKDSRVRGVLLWNVWEQVDAARRLIAEPGPFDAQNLKGRLPR